MHARLSLLTATAAILFATSALAAPPTTSAASSTPAAASSTATPAAPAANTRMAAASTSQTRTTSSSTALYTRAQQKLKEMGLYSGPLDGSRNATFVTSLRKFQRDHHLQVSGRLNTQTQRALGI
jgi:peptidoglycan hydrolase-like protein with peptidoglycan-binding domain